MVRFKKIIYALTILLVCSQFNLLGVDNPVYINKICLNRADSIATISWKNPNDICGSFTKHKIYGREDILGDYKLLDSVLNLTQEEIQIKLPNVKEWQFYMVTKAACNGLDSFTSIPVSVDFEQPVLWEIDSVSVDLVTQKTLVGWRNHPAQDKEGYFVYYVNNNNVLISDTTSLQILDTLYGNPSLQSERYALATYDSCGNTSPISAGHKTIFLSQNYDTCDRSISLNWTSYEPLINGRYIIKYSEDSVGVFESIDTVNSNINSFKVNNLVANKTYCFVIQVIQDNPTVFSSTSNRVCIQTPPVISASNYINYVSVNERQHIKIGFTSDLTSGFVQLLRLNNILNTWNLIESYTATPNFFMEYTDTNVLVSQQTYTYRLAHIDNCLNPIVSDSSLHTTSILLTAEEFINSAELEWTSYEFEERETEEYQIFKMVSPQIIPRSTWNFNGITLPPNTFLIDNYFSDEPAYSVCFCVRAMQSPNPISNQRDTAYSNSVCFLRELSIYFPTAFSPTGFNTTFKGVGVGIDINRSLLTIYTRWGEKIFETTNITKGWDGTDMNGNACAQGTYLYNAYVKGDLGAEKEFKGIITLIR